MVNLKITYDRPVDVLHIRNGKGGLFEASDLERGVELDFSLEDGLPCGATIIGFERNHWREEIDKLASLIASHLSIMPEVLACLITQKVGMGR